LFGRRRGARHLGGGSAVEEDHHWELVGALHVRPSIDVEIQAVGAARLTVLNAGRLVLDTRRGLLRRVVDTVPLARRHGRPPGQAVHRRLGERHSEKRMCPAQASSFELAVGSGDDQTGALLVRRLSIGRCDTPGGRRQRRDHRQGARGGDQPAPRPFRSRHLHPGFGLRQRTSHANSRVSRISQYWSPPIPMVTAVTSTLGGVGGPNNAVLRYRPRSRE